MKPNKLSMFRIGEKVPDEMFHKYYMHGKERVDNVLCTVTVHVHVAVIGEMFMESTWSLQTPSLYMYMYIIKVS